MYLKLQIKYLHMQREVCNNSSTDRDDKYFTWGEGVDGNE